MGLGAASCNSWTSLRLENRAPVEDQPLRIRPGSHEQTLANGRFGGGAQLCGLDGFYKRSPRAGGKK